MILFAVYAVLVWYLAMRHRRDWRGYAVVVAGVSVLLLIARPAMGEHNLLAGLLPPGIRNGYRHLTILLVGEAGLVGLIGLFIASLPRAESPTACRHCRYELRGLEPRGLTCPECGTAYRGPGSGLEEPPITLTPQYKSWAEAHNGAPRTRTL